MTFNIRYGTADDGHLGPPVADAAANPVGRLVAVNGGVGDGHDGAVPSGVEDGAAHGSRGESPVARKGAVLDGHGAIAVEAAAAKAADLGVSEHLAANEPYTAAASHVDAAALLLGGVADDGATQ